MIRRLFPQVSLLLTVAACGDATPRAELPSVSREDLAVFAAVLDSLYMHDERVDTITDSLPLTRPYLLTDPSVTGPIPGHPARYSFEFSRVGYSSARDYALVAVVFHCVICGEGQSVLLVREANRWRVVAASVDWVS